MFLAGLYAQETRGPVVVIQQARKHLRLTLGRAALLTALLAELLVAEPMPAAQICPAEQAVLVPQGILAQGAEEALLTQGVGQVLAAVAAAAAADILCVAKKAVVAAAVSVCMDKGRLAHNQRLVMA